jgi:hypothetical protein
LLLNNSLIYNINHLKASITFPQLVVLHAIYAYI